MPETKYEAIVQDILAKIGEGTYTAGGQLPSISKLCEMYGCSKAPARAALESLRKQGIIWSRRGSGSFVFESEKRDEPLIFGLLQPGYDISTAQLRLNHCISTRLSELGHLLMHCGRYTAPYGDTRTEFDWVAPKQLTKYGLSGAFLYPFAPKEGGTEATLGLVSLLRRAEVSIVVVDRNGRLDPSDFRCDTVGQDGWTAGLKAANLLFWRDAFPFVCVAGPDRRQDLLPMIHGVYQSIVNNGRSIPEGIIRFGDLHSPEFLESLLLMSSGDEARAVFCMDDGTASILAELLVLRGKRIPEDILLVGFNDTKEGFLVNPPITTIRQSPESLARLVVQTMMERRASPETPGRRILNTPWICLGPSTQRPELPKRSRKSRAKNP